MTAPGIAGAPLGSVELRRPPSLASPDSRIRRWLIRSATPLRPPLLLRMKFVSIPASVESTCLWPMKRLCGIASSD